MKKLSFLVAMLLLVSVSSCKDEASEVKPLYATPQAARMSEDPTEEGGGGGGGGGGYVTPLGRAINAALHGPEVKKIKIFSHEFNVKQANITTSGSRKIIAGQISHHLSARPDDQVYYTIIKEGDTIVAMEIKIARGGLAPIIAPIASVVAAYFGVPLTPAIIEEFGRKVGTILDGSWEAECEHLIYNIALKV